MLDFFPCRERHEVSERGRQATKRGPHGAAPRVSKQEVSERQAEMYSEPNAVSGSRHGAAPQGVAPRVSKRSMRRSREDPSLRDPTYQDVTVKALTRRKPTVRADMRVSDKSLGKSEEKFGVWGKVSTTKEPEARK